MFHFLNHWIDGISTICYTFPERSGDYTMKMPTWIWYYGDFEIRQHLLVGTRRLEENLYRPAPWKLDDCWHNIRFRREYTLVEPEKFRVTIDGNGSVQINQQYFSAGNWLEAPSGKVEIIVEASNVFDLPSIFVEGKSILSDGSWEASYDNFHFSKVGYWNFDRISSPPSQFALPCRPLELKPLPCEKGFLYDAGKETFARLELNMDKEGFVRIYYGESMTEVMDENPNMWLETAAKPLLSEPARAFRYLRIVPEADAILRDIRAYYEYLPLCERGEFSCSDETVNEIWKVSCYTLELNSREFFLDGIKRDRYVWSGDAYQSYLLNYYLYFDHDICKRTTLALRGKDPMERHINTIMDYSFYWVLGIWDYYLYTGDLDFIKRIFPRIQSLMDFCIERTDSDALMCEQPGDWIFVDWAENLDKEGPICIEQILFAKALETLAELGSLLGYEISSYQSRAVKVIEKLKLLYWSEEKGAFIDSFRSGKSTVTRQTNLFALRFGIADERQAERIRKNVLDNEAIPAITTPYFKFYELESLCAMGRQEDVTEKMLAYWGGMLRLGATSFWEEYDPSLNSGEHLHMYGKPYGKSLCHAWGASPIYLLGRFYLGVTPQEPGYRSYVVEPKLGGLNWMKGVVPVPGGFVRVSVTPDRIEVLSDITGGILKVGAMQIPIEANKPAVVDLQL